MFLFLLSICNEKSQQKHSHAHTHIHTERDEQNSSAHIKIARKKNNLIGHGLLITMSDNAYFNSEIDCQFSLFQLFRMDRFMFDFEKWDAVETNQQFLKARDTLCSHHFESEKEKEKERDMKKCNVYE